MYHTIWYSMEGHFVDSQIFFCGEVGMRSDIKKTVSKNQLGQGGGKKTRFLYGVAIIGIN